MTWIIGALVLLVLYLVASIWSLRRGHQLESKVMRAHVTLLWRRVRGIIGDAVPVEEVYKELRKLGVEEAEAWFWSGGYGLAQEGLRSTDGELTDDLTDSATLSESDVKIAQRTASDYYSDMAQRDYLGNEAHEKLRRQEPLWRMRYATAVLALDELEAEHYRPLRGRNGHNDPIDAYFSLTDTERRTMDDEWAKKYEGWKQRHPEAARAKETMSAQVFREYDEYTAIRTMPEMTAARKRDYERRTRSGPEDFVKTD